MPDAVQPHQSRHTGGQELRVHAAVSTNLADRGYVSDALADALTEAGFACHVLGDSKRCGNLRDATEGGYKAACEL